MLFGVFYGTWFIMAAFVLYIGAAISYAAVGHWSQALIWVSYATANIGLALVAQGVK